MIKLKPVLIALRKLKKEDYRVLISIERGMAKHEYVPIEYIEKIVNIDKDFLLKRLRFLNSLGLIQRKKMFTISYILTSRGYDVLAFNALNKRGVLKAVSLTPYNVGKESDVYLGLSTSNRKLIVKINRLGRTCFRKTRLLRMYIGDRRHISWLYQSRLAAEREYNALTTLYKNYISVPKPITWNRHIVIMDYVDGLMLAKIAKLSNPEEIFNKIMNNVIKAYRDVGIIHGDLNEYNVILNPSDRKVYIIDWPQWIPRNHVLARKLLLRDIKYIGKFFKKKYGYQPIYPDII